MPCRTSATTECPRRLSLSGPGWRTRRTSLIIGVNNEQFNNSAFGKRVNYRGFNVIYMKKLSDELVVQQLKDYQALIQSGRRRNVDGVPILLAPFQLCKGLTEDRTTGPAISR